jgi:HK97 family phage prohead protease
MAPTIEYRRASFSPSSGQAPKASQSGGKWVFSGYVFAWDTPSDDLGGYTEIIRRGAAAKVLADPNNVIFGLLDHDKAVRNILGDNRSGSLSLVEDDHGLAYILRPADTTAAEDCAKIIRSGSPVGVSFAFVCGRQERATLPDGSMRRTILEFAAIEEISLVVDAAYKSSTVSAIEMGKTRQRPALPAERSNAAPSVDYLRRQLDQAEAEFACRSNPHHDEAGKFHDGSPGQLLSASQGRLRKAMARHDRAKDAYAEKDGTGQWVDLQDSRLALQAAIDEADAVTRDVTAMHEDRCSDHRAMVDASRRKFAQLVAQAAGAP